MNAHTARWFAEYAADHRHPRNRLTHKIAIPLIVVTSVMMLAWVPITTVAGHAVTLATLGWVAGGGFWAWALPRSGGLLALATLPIAIWGGAVPVAVVLLTAAAAWGIQLAGHAIWEKNRPSFLHNMLHALIGPLFFAALLTGELRRPASA